MPQGPHSSLCTATAPTVSLYLCVASTTVSAFTLYRTHTSPPTTSLRSNSPSGSPRSPTHLITQLVFQLTCYYSFFSLPSTLFPPAATIPASLSRPQYRCVTHCTPGTSISGCRGPQVFTTSSSASTKPFPRLHCPRLCISRPFRNPIKPPRYQLPYFV